MRRFIYQLKTRIIRSNLLHQRLRFLELEDKVLVDRGSCCGVQKTYQPVIPLQDTL